MTESVTLIPFLMLEPLITTWTECLQIWMSNSALNSLLHYLSCSRQFNDLFVLKKKNKDWGNTYILCSRFSILIYQYILQCVYICFTQMTRPFHCKYYHQVSRQNYLSWKDASHPYRGMKRVFQYIFWPRRISVR